MTEHSVPWTPPRDILTSDEAATYLRITVPTLLRLVRAGDVPASRIGRAYRFSRRALEQLVSETQEV